MVQVLEDEHGCDVVKPDNVFIYKERLDIIKDDDIIRA